MLPESQNEGRKTFVDLGLLAFSADFYLLVYRGWRRVEWGLVLFLLR